MAPKSMLVLAIVLFCVSYTLPIKGIDLSKHVHAEYKVAGLMGGPQSRKAAGNTIRGYPVKASDGYLHVAGYESRRETGNTWWHGVRAKINVWGIPDVQSLSESSAYIAAINDTIQVETIAAGVQVNPSMYNNTDLHFFTYWTTTSKSCYNVDCPGFVIAKGSNLLPGQALAPLSNYGGEMRYITIRIKKDEKTGDWSLYREDLGGPIGGLTLLGWWPRSLFQSLSDSANIIQWSGAVRHYYNETSPSMGSGHSAGELEGKAAGFYDCFGFDSDGTVYKRDVKASPYADRPECYNVSSWYDTGRPGYQHFFYGGPSGCFH